MLTYMADATIGKRAGALLLGPVVGLGYVVVLPFISVAAIIVMIGGKTLGKAWDLTRSLAFFEWRPSEAYLAGKKKKESCLQSR
jgi:hypothetical protein